MVVFLAARGSNFAEPVPNSKEESEMEKTTNNCDTHGHNFVALKMKDERDEKTGSLTFQYKLMCTKCGDLKNLA